MSDEFVLCMDAHIPAEYQIGQGFTPFGHGYLQHPELFINHADHFILREFAERDEAYKQVIPYCVLEKQPAARADPELFVYRRLRDRESRLKGNLSIGVGGHVNPADTEGLTGFSGVARALCRELREEVSYAPVMSEQPHLSIRAEKPRWLGVINDESSEVGRVHLGIVAALRVAPPIAPAHDDWDQYGIYAASALRDMLEEFESWSQIILRDVYGLA